MKKIAIIGAGLSGLTLAAELTRYLPDADIQVFEKARGPGGRMSTRRAIHDGNEFTFDHGAQFFTIRSSVFHNFLAPFLENGTVKPWQIEVEKEQVYVGAPAMNSLCKALAADLDVHAGVRIEHLTKTEGGWTLTADSQALGPYDLVVSSAPAPQTAQLFGDYFAHQSALADVQFLPCFALMLGFARSLPIERNAFRPPFGNIGWVGFNSTKPGRAQGQTSLVVHTTAEWSAEHLEENAADLLETIRDMAQAFLPFDLSRADFAAVHKWRYANVLRPVSGHPAQPYVYDKRAQLAAVGDWCKSGRVEAAFESAYALAARLGA